MKTIVSSKIFTNSQLRYNERLLLISLSSLFLYNEIPLDIFRELALNLIQNIN